MLPKVNGLEVLQALRARPGGKQVPVVAITAYSFTRDVAALGQGEMVVRRGEHFSALEMTRWLETVLQAMPARHLTPGGPVSEPAPVPTG
jgi:CheY-like chemotaxis protein